MTNKIIQPRGEYILVETEPKKETVLDGIILPESFDKEIVAPIIGKILALGTAVNDPDRSRRFSVNVGDTIVIEKSSGMKLSEPFPSEYLLIKESDILLILNNKK